MEKRNHTDHRIGNSSSQPVDEKRNHTNDRTSGKRYAEEVHVDDECCSECGSRNLESSSFSIQQLKYVRCVSTMGHKFSQDQIQLPQVPDLGSGYHKSFTNCTSGAHNTSWVSGFTGRYSRMRKLDYQL